VAPYSHDFTPANDLITDDGVVSRADLAEWEEEFERVCSRMNPLFYRPESRKHTQQYVRGLLAPIERKNGWTIAEHVGEKEPKATQRFLNLTPWEADDLSDLNRDYAMEYPADPRGVLIADDTGFRAQVDPFSMYTGGGAPPLATRERSAIIRRPGTCGAPMESPP
jgi:hypothetical protein